MSRRDDVRCAYDAAAATYGRLYFHELDNKPFDRMVLRRFAEETAGGRVCDMGCGPGEVAAYLAQQGADVFGIDLSARMIEQARALSPTIEFRRGDMTQLDLDADSLAGVAAFYAIVNIPLPELAPVFAELHRVLRPGGLLLVSFHVGDAATTVASFLDSGEPLEFFFFQPEPIMALAEASGLIVDEVVLRYPYRDKEHATQRCYLWCSKPSDYRGRSRVSVHGPKPR